MKRIVNGVTYNTATSTRLAECRWSRDDDEIFGTLYQTRGGAFFADEEITRQIWNEDERTHQREMRHSFEPLSPEGAHKWLLDGDVEIFSNPFDDPPEATAEAESGATIYIRVPASLKRAVDDAAKAAKVSGNVWAMRCLEKCLEATSVPDELARGSGPSGLPFDQGTNFTPVKGR
jgi:predicted HicB family RNase H-like nuclease